MVCGYVLLRGRLSPTTARREPIPALFSIDSLFLLLIMFSPIRHFRASDADSLDNAAARFCQRHGISLDLERDCLGDNEKTYDALALFLFYCDDKRLVRLWQSCFCRALKIKPAANVRLAYGYIGYSVKD